MSFYLLENPNPYGQHFYTARRRPLLAIVVHITAGLEDLDTVDDHSAEATARYAATTDRAVSWHSGSDADSALDLLPASYTAWHCRGYNAATYGHEISKRTTDWRALPHEWRTRTITRAAQHLAPVARAHGIPARQATRAELDAAVAAGGPPVGFVSHAVLDPDRRTDPGLVAGVDTFPWGDFFAALTSTDVDHQENDDMAPMQRVTIAGTTPQAFAYLFPGGLLIDQDHQGRPLVATAGSAGAFDAVALGTANQLQVDIVQAAIARATGIRAPGVEAKLAQIDMRVAALVEIESREEAAAAG